MKADGTYNYCKIKVENVLDDIAIWMPEDWFSVSPPFTLCTPGYFLSLQALPEKNHPPKALISSILHTANKTPRLHSKQDSTLTQQTRLHAYTANKTPRLHSKQDSMRTWMYYSYACAKTQN